ncbi:hypothetical protein [Paratractidigestivibacter sp.]|uniref:hypothetical protein n=1 Tax=Paratractidigestivibacter sp. TaxID=2847316 RepID=UPI002ACB07EE|nr:hypothetical protein [Paratractidigestivibacter sp.]
MSSEAITSLSEAFLAASLPLDPGKIPAAAARVIDFYKNAPKKTRLPEEEVVDRFEEMWGLWFEGASEPTRELKDIIGEAIAVDGDMDALASGYFALEKKLESQYYMAREHAVALIGSAPLIRALVVEQHLGLDRIKGIINVPGATYDAIKSILSVLGVGVPFDMTKVPELHDADVNDVSGLFGDTLPEDADVTFKGLLGNFSRSKELGEDVAELVYIGFEPYLFILYYELLTLELADRFPGRAIYEHSPRSSKVKALWNEMYNPTQENPYLNNAKSVYSLDEAWAETKLSPSTGNGSLMLADAFDIMAELPYTTRRRVAHVIRCYLVLMASETQASTPLPPATPDNIRALVTRVCESNSCTKGVLDQRLVDFLTMCSHEYAGWTVRGLGSSVNESNASGRKFGDVEYMSLVDKGKMEAYEAHGGGLRDEYVTDHVHSLAATVEYFKKDYEERGEKYERDVEIVYVAHDTSRLERYKNGHQEMIDDIPFEFRFITFKQLVDEAGGMDDVCEQTELYDRLIHSRISRLPDAYMLKRKYIQYIS